jgi:suppressor of tumorigenicity protein 13
MQLNAASTTCRLAILYFHKARPCRFISPFYASLDRKYPKVVFLKVDIEDAEAQDVTTAWKIRRAPYFFFLKNGKQVDKVVGIDADELETKVKLHSRKQASKLARRR